MRAFTSFMPRGNLRNIGAVALNLDPPSVGANTTGTFTATVPGVLPGDIVFVNKPTATTGLGVANAFVSAVNTVTIQLMNNTASAIDAPLERYLILIVRPDHAANAA